MLTVYQDERQDLTQELMRLQKKAQKKMSSGENARVSEILDRLEQLEGIIANEKRIAEAPHLQRSQKEPIRPDPQAGMGYQRRGSHRASEFASMGEEMCAIVKDGKHDPRVARMQAQQRIGDPASGGFLTTPEMAAELLELVVQTSDIMRLAKIYTMSTTELIVAGADDRDHSGSIAGLTAAWLGEGSTMAVDTLVHRAIQFTSKKIGILCRGSREYFRDAYSAEAFIKDVMAKAIAFYLDRAFIRGTGAAQPAGILGASCLLTVNKEVGQLAQTFTWQNATDMFTRFSPGATNGFWLISPSLKSEVLNMSVGVGTAGTSFWFQLRDATERGLTLLGLPVHWSEHCSYKGTLGDVLLCNGPGYLIGMRQELEIDVSIFPYYASDELAVRAILRCDGMPAQSAALTMADGSLTTSDFVTLQART